MQLTKLLFSYAFFALLLSTTALAHGKYNASVFNDSPRIDEPTQQAPLRQQANWQQFKQKHGNWHVAFNTLTELPLRAGGKPIAVAGSDVVTKAQNFLKTTLQDLNIPIHQLKLTKVNRSDKHTYVNFIQEYEGVELLFSKVQVRFNHKNEVVAFVADAFNEVAVHLQPSLGKVNLLTPATADMGEEHWEIAVRPENKILPIPTAEGYRFALVYEANVTHHAHEGEAPADYYTVIDAHTGELYYRYDLVGDAPDIPVMGSIIDNPLQAREIRQLPNIKVEIEGETYFTNEQGVLEYDGDLPVEATVIFEGKFASVRDGQGANNSPRYTTTIEEANPVIDIPLSVDSSILAGYYHTDLVHQFMKSQLPAEFDALDYPLPVFVNRTDDVCNAFYDGESINFYGHSGGCYSTVLFSDVVYHEYGHGINDKYYEFLGSFFANGAMNEGYADIWGLLITGHPVLGQGGLRVGGGFVRRYNSVPKRYPEDIMDQVHNDGEIIAGSWWRLGELIGLDNMRTIFVESQLATSMRPGGQEGPLYGDLLFDALIVDDDNGDLSDGTPHINEILEAFGEHGIVPFLGIDVEHEEVELIPSGQPMQVPFRVKVDFDYQELIKEARVYYRTDKSLETFGRWSVGLDFLDGSFVAPIPLQPDGAVVEYYVEITDERGILTQVVPEGADIGISLPYQTIVGLVEKDRDDLFANSSNWTIGDPTDNATSGIWEIGSILPSSFSGDPIQAGEDHTLTTDNFCAFTGNAPSGEVFANEVSDGKTTLYSPVYDLTPYQIPAFQYYRWYFNFTFNPNGSTWLVQITNNGVDWVTVEETSTPEQAWRKVALKVSDFVAPTENVQLRFIVDEPTDTATPFGSAGVSEAAVDDLSLFDLADVLSVSETTVDHQIIVYPNPAQEEFHVLFQQPVNGAATNISLFNVSGQQVFQQTRAKGQNPSLTIETKDLPAGIYILSVEQNGQTTQEKVVVSY